MNFIKTTIATAAVITCCLGNEMPAKSETLAQQNYRDIDRAIENTFTAVDNGDLGTACSQSSVAVVLLRSSLSELQDMKPDFDWFKYIKTTSELQEMTCGWAI